MDNEVIVRDGQEFDGKTGELIVKELPEGFGEGQTALAVQLAGVEIDRAITTARAYPRKPALVMQAILSLATLDHATAEECIYSLPRAGKAIQGPSIRLAEIIASQWGNSSIGARVTETNIYEKYIEAEGVFHDLETNVRTTSRVRRSIADKNGKLLKPDMLVVIGNAACSIALRNAILRAVPKAVWRKAYDAVHNVIKGDVKTLVERRDRAMKAFADYGVTPQRVIESLGLSGMDDITIEHMPILVGAHAALKSGEGQVEDLFPVKSEPVKDGEKPKSMADRLAALAEDPKKKKQVEDSKSKADKTETGTSSAGSDADGKRAPSSTSATATGGQPASDKPPSDAGDKIAEANKRGQDAGADGKSTLKSIPKEYRADEALADAWIAGYKKTHKA